MQSESHHRTAHYQPRRVFPVTATGFDDLVHGRSHTGLDVHGQMDTLAGYSNDARDERLAVSYRLINCVGGGYVMAHNADV